MRKFVILCTVTVFSACSANSPTFPTIRSAGRAGPESVYILPVLRQEEMAVQVKDAFLGAFIGGMGGGAIGGAVGAIVDSAVEGRRARKAEHKAEALREAASDYDLFDNLRIAVAMDNAGAGWTLETVGDITGDTEIPELVRGIFADTDVDAVIVLTAHYLLTPDLDQVSVSITQQAFPRKHHTSRGKTPIPSKPRRFSYLSPIHVPVYRPFLADEKAAYRDATIQSYEATISMQPNSEVELRTELNQKLKEIDEATEIPEAMAVAETWTPELLSAYLDQAKIHLRYMLDFAWNERVRKSMVGKEGEAFDAWTELGHRVELTGRSITNIDGNTIYRIFGGALFSVPQP